MFLLLTRSENGQVVQRMESSWGSAGGARMEAKSRFRPRPREGSQNSRPGHALQRGRTQCTDLVRFLATERQSEDNECRVGCSRFRSINRDG